MKKSIFFGTLILVVLLSLVGEPGFAARAMFDPNTAASLPNPASSPWFISWVDRSTSTDVGAYPSVAYSPIDGLPYLSYYDAVNGDLVLASPVPNGGSNCGVGGNWWCRAVDGSGVNGSSLDNVGTYSSADFWKGLEGSTPVWKFGIAYHDNTTHALKYAVFTQYPSTWTWDFQTILSTSLAGSDVGLYNSLKFASDGRPKIAFYQTSALTGSLNLAVTVSGSGNCGEGTDLGMWHCDMVDSGAGVGQFASLSIDYNQNPSMAYYDGANGNLKYAFYYGFGGGNCGDSNTYRCETVDDSIADVGRSASLVAPRSMGGPSQIAYYDRTNGTLKYAFETLEHSAANCVGRWWCGNVDTIGAGLAQAGISMAVDKYNSPVIAYEDASELMGPSKLKIARNYVSLGLSTGNCGDVFPEMMFPSWQCSILDNATYGSGNIDLAGYTALAFSASGLATIAYLETDNYYATNSLKVATQLFQTFLPLLKR